MRSLQLIGLHLRVVAMHEMQYRVNFFIQLFQSAMALGTGLVMLALVYSHVDEVRGWSQAELLVVLGVYTVVGGFLRMVVWPSLGRFLEDVEQGTLDHLLAKPVDAQLLASIRMTQIWQGVNVIVGAVVLGVGLARLDSPVTVTGVLGFAAGIILGITMIYSFMLGLASTAFWIIRVDPLVEMFDGVFQAARWPVGIYPNWMRIGLTAIVPVGLAVTVPAEALTGQLTGMNLGIAAALAAVLAVASRLLWRAGLRHYAGASS